MLREEHLHLLVSLLHIRLIDAQLIDPEPGMKMVVWPRTLAFLFKLLETLSLTTEM